MCLKDNILKFGLIALLIVGWLPDAAAINRRLHRYELSLGGGLCNFMGDICSPKNKSTQVWILPPNTTGLAFNTGLKYNLGHRDECGFLKLSEHSVGGSLRFGQMRAEDPLNNDAYWSRNIGFTSFFAELSVRYEWYFISEKPNHVVFKQVGKPIMKGPTRMPSYLFAGVGGLLNFGHLYRFKDKEEIFAQSFSNLAPVVQFGAGTKYRVVQGVCFTLEAGWSWALNDGLDNCKGNQEPTADIPWKFGNYIDQYQYVILGVTLKLRETEKHLPDFRSIGK